MKHRPLTPEGARAFESLSNSSNPLVSMTGSGYSGIDEKSGPLHSLVEQVMTYAFAILVTINLYLAIREFDWLSLVLIMMIAAPIAWVLADFVSGLIHWFADTYGAEDTPLFGPWLIRPFRQHHVYPRDICTHDLVVTIGNSCTIAVPFQAGVLYLMLTNEEVSITKALLFFAFNLFAIAIVATNVFHKWAHAETTNAFVSSLQRSRLLLNPAHHDLHHTKPFASNYCITNGWLNPLLEKVRFFRRVESALCTIGIKPNESSYVAVAIKPSLVALKSESGDS